MFNFQKNENTWETLVPDSFKFLITHRRSKFKTKKTIIINVFTYHLQSRYVYTKYTFYSQRTIIVKRPPRDKLQIKYPWHVAQTSVVVYAFVYIFIYVVTTIIISINLRIYNTVLSPSLLRQQQTAVTE